MKKTLYAISIIFIVSFLNTELTAQTNKYWIFLKDKDTALLQKSSGLNELGKSILSERSIWRRTKTLGVNFFQISDLPVSKNYLSELENRGIKLVVVSRWLNAVSCYLPQDRFDEICSLPFVKGIKRVGRAARPRPDDTFKDLSETIKDALKTNRVYLDSVDYGNSYIQNENIRSIDLHNIGVTGKGILVGVVDTGFDLTHESLENANVIAEYDFINNDEVTSNESSQDVSTQDLHGTTTLSAVGGYKEGKLIGTAYGASFILAKTEHIPSETPAEEDFYVAALEWMDVLGADIITSSIGYSNFNDPADDYLPSDMDGKTAVTTIASEMAVEKGIVVMTSAGNEGNSPWGIITSPADGEHVITVGAVYSNGQLASFSSTGPTADGRIKPDVVALGVGVWTGGTSSTDSYTGRQGTSYSAPLTAGAAALILSAHPDLSPAEVMTAFRETADRAISPDNEYGYGQVDAFGAATFFGPVFSNMPEVQVIAEGYEITSGIVSINGVNDNTPVLYYRTENSAVENSVPMSRILETTFYKAVIPEQTAGDSIYFYFTVEDMAGQTTVFPNDSMGSAFQILAGLTDVNHPGFRDRTKTRTFPEKIALMENYPDPFNNETIIIVENNKYQSIKIEIFNILGRKIKTLTEKTLPPGIYNFHWNGTDDHGSTVASGLYFYRLLAPEYINTKKMMFLR